MVAELAESIVRNPEALTFLTQLRRVDEYLTFHSLNVCIFALVFGRHLGLSREDLHALGLGALLHDIGYTKLPANLIGKPGQLTPREFDVMKTHVEQGVAILRGAVGIPAAAVEAVQDHHERLDGSGYPRGLSAGKIGIFGLATAIVDSYDAATTDRPWRSGSTPYDALGDLYRRRKSEFHEGLVLEFIQCVGIYPVGSLVELTTGDVAVVLTSDPRYRLLPKVRLMMDPEGRRYETPIIVDLLHPHGSGIMEPIKIKAAVHPGVYGITGKDLAEATFLH